MKPVRQDLRAPRPRGTRAPGRAARRRDDALDAHRVQLLEALQLARLGRGLERRERRQRHQLAARARDVDLARAARASAARCA